MDKEEYRQNQEKRLELWKTNRTIFHKKLKDAFKIIWRNPDEAKNKSNDEWDLYVTPGTFPGWNDIIWDCSARLENLCKEAISIIPIEKMPVASQIKEKFGRLRFYIDYKDEYPEDFKNNLMSVITDAENKSNTICENCGKHGSLRSETPDRAAAPFFWLKTLCLNCWYGETINNIDYNIMFSPDDQKPVFEKRKQNLIELFEMEKGEEKS